MGKIDNVQGVRVYIVDKGKEKVFYVTSLGNEDSLNTYFYL